MVLAIDTRLNFVRAHRDLKTEAFDVCETYMLFVLVAMIYKTAAATSSY